MSELCDSCGKPADVEITSTMQPLTAQGERMCERVAKHTGKKTVGLCLSCAMRVGQGIVDGEFAEEDP